LKAQAESSVVNPSKEFGERAASSRLKANPRRECQMKKWLSLATLLVLSLALFIGVACGEDEEEEGVTELKMGIGVPLSGLYGAVVGVPAKHAYSMAVEDIGVFTVGGEQYRWKLIIEDNMATTAGGIASATKLIFEDNVDFMIQAAASSALAAQPLCEEKGIILTASGLNPVHLTPDRPQLFQTSGAWAVNVTPFFEWLSKEHPEVKRIASAVPDDDNGYALVDAFDACADYYGLEVVAAELVPLSTTEYYPVATRITARDPDLVFSAGAGFAALMWEMGYEGLSATWWWLPGYADQAGWEKCQGFLICMPHQFGGLWPEAEALVAEFEERYDVECSAAVFWGLNAMYVWTEVLKQAGTVDDVDKILETMETGSFDTLVGPLSFGGEVLNGYGHVAIWPSPIYEVVGEHEYRVIDVYTIEETEAILAEVYK
jgi:ABC-type branched-subunit amino acid transport system substrate-binding protein